MKRQLAIARGREAFTDGMTRIVTDDTDFMSEIYSDYGNAPVGTGQFTGWSEVGDRLKAWYEGWDRANLQADIETATDRIKEFAVATTANPVLADLLARNSNWLI